MRFEIRSLGKGPIKEEMVSSFCFSEKEALHIHSIFKHFSLDLKMSSWKCCFLLPFWCIIDFLFSSIFRFRKGFSFLCHFSLLAFIISKAFFFFYLFFLFTWKYFIILDETLSDIFEFSLNVRLKNFKQISLFNFFLFADIFFSETRRQITFDFSFVFGIGEKLKIMENCRKLN